MGDHVVHGGSKTVGITYEVDDVFALLAGLVSPLAEPPVPTDQHSRIIRARRVVAAAEQAAQAEAAGDPPGAAFKHRKPKNLPSVW